MARSASHHSILILSSLVDEDRHGYAIKDDVAARTGNEVRLGATSLYRVLGQLLDEGLIVELPSDPADDQRRRRYRITRAGRRALVAELARLERVLLAARGAMERRPS
jgi:DNA-binding PadR family transcriptional regulator